MNTLTVLYISMGVLASVAVFLYTLPLIRGKKRKKKKAPPVMPEIVIGKCPRCGSSLTARDKLYTKTYEAEPRDKIFVKGCSKCYDIHKHTGL